MIISTSVVCSKHALHANHHMRQLNDVHCPHSGVNRASSTKHQQLWPTQNPCLSLHDPCGVRNEMQCHQIRDRMDSPCLCWQLAADRVSSSTKLRDESQQPPTEPMHNLQKHLTRSVTPTCLTSHHTVGPRSSYRRSVGSQSSCEPSCIARCARSLSTLLCLTQCKLYTFRSCVCPMIRV